MKNIIPLGKLITPCYFEKYIDEFEKLETIKHTYGETQNGPTYPHIMEYANFGKIKGSISFSRHTYDHPILKKMSLTIKETLISLFPSNYELLVERVHILKTIGSIRPHRDESGRMCCINIGIKNTASALTKVSNNDVNSEFSEYTLNDGEAYLLNTNAIHEVIGDLETPRYLITYGFAKPFSIITQYI